MAALCLCTVVLVVLSSHAGGVELDLTALSESLADLANRKLGVEAVQVHTQHQLCMDVGWHSS